MPTHACSCAREFLRLAGVCALRLPTTSSAEVPAAGTHNIKRASPDALGSTAGGTLIRKTNFTLLQDRSDSARSSVTDLCQSRFKFLLAQKIADAKTSGVCAIACDQRHLRRPERSPLHDVRQHARRCLVGQPTGEFVFLTDEIAIDRTAVLVEPDGIEPTTSCLQSRRSPN